MAMPAGGTISIANRLTTTNLSIAILYHQKFNKRERPNSLKALPKSLSALKEIVHKITYCIFFLSRFFGNFLQLPDP
jgi:hypothetical protein